MNYEINPTAPRCNAVRCFAYWDGKCSALTDSHFKAGCPFFKDKEQKELEDLRCEVRVRQWKAKQDKKR